MAIEQARLDASRTGDRKLAEAIITMLASGGAEGAAPVEIASLMRAVGLPPDGRYLVAAMCAQADRVAGPDTDRWRYELAEELALPLAEGTLVGPLGDEIIVLVPLPPGTEPDPADGGSAAHVFAARMREARPAVEADRSRVRLSVGVSAPATGVVALSGALHEASSARRLAALHSEAAITIVTSDEVASHELLLATVPGSAARIPGLLRFLERLRHDDVRARQHRAVPDQADRGAHRTRSVLAG